MINDMIFYFDIVNFPFLDGNFPRSASYGVYISQLIRFARMSSHVDDFNNRNKVLIAFKLSEHQCIICSRSVRSTLTTTGPNRHTKYHHMISD